MNSIDKKVKLSNKIYPYFYGISSDLMFYIAIDTLFLSIVKGYNDAQINFFTTFSMLAIIVFQPLNLRIIKKIGNINSIKLGVWILLIAAIIITFSNNYYIMLIGFALYEIAYIFKSMENVVLKRNLKHFNKEDEFIKVQSMGSTIYSIITLIISLVAIYLFTLNNYLPMYLCIACCVINIVLSEFLYEASYEETTKVSKTKFKLTKIIFILMLAYTLGYSIVSLAQSNSKLFIQKDLLNLVGVEKTSIYLIIIVAISRIIRVLSNLIFPKIYNKFKSKILFAFSFLITLSYILILLGNMLAKSITGIYIMCIGLFTYLAIRDPFQNYIKDLLLNNCKKSDQEVAITYLELSKNIQKFLLSLLITLMLLKYNLSQVFYLFLIISLIEIFIITELYRTINKE